MNTHFDYQTVPHSFAYCLHQQCSLAQQCLRQKIAQNIPIDFKYITIINPSYIPPKDKNCTYFKECKTIRLASGMLHLFDNINHKDAIIIKQQMFAHFKRSMYYRIRNGERFLKPHEQDYIRQLFLDRGITQEPVYDVYIDQYDW